MDPTTKTDLLDVIRREHQRLMNLVAQLSDDEMLQPGMNGDWSAKDELAHITAWEQEFLGWYRAGQRGEVPERPDPDNIDPFNRQLYEQHRDEPLAEVRAAFEASYQEILNAVASMSEDDLFRVGRFAWTGEYPLLVYLRANTDEHYAEHTPQFEAWLAARGRG
jgi:hypothetical protein